MKDLKHLIGIVLLMTFASCGGKSESKPDGVTPSPENNSEEYAQFITIPSEPVQIKANSHILELEISPKIKAAAGKGIDYDGAEVILFDAEGNKLASLHSFGVNQDFEKALFQGTEYDDTFTFIKSMDSEEDAQAVIQKAKQYRLKMPLVSNPKIEKLIAKENGAGDETTSSENDYFKIGEWTIPGTYEFTDEENVEWIMTLDEDRKALLTTAANANNPDALMKGTWKKNTDGEFIDLKFPSGPIITIGGHMGNFSFAMTSDHLYYNSESCEDKNPEQRIGIEKTK